MDALQIADSVCGGLLLTASCHGHRQPAVESPMWRPCRLGPAHCPLRVHSYIAFLVYSEAIHSPFSRIEFSVELRSPPPTSSLSHFYFSLECLLLAQFNFLFKKLYRILEQGFLTMELLIFRLGSLFFLKRGSYEPDYSWTHDFLSLPPGCAPSRLALYRIMYMYMHFCVYICVHVYICMSVYLCLCVCMSMCVWQVVVVSCVL